MSRDFSKQMRQSGPGQNRHFRHLGETNPGGHSPWQSKQSGSSIEGLSVSAVTASTTGFPCVFGNATLSSPLVVGVEEEVHSLGLVQFEGVGTDGDVSGGGGGGDVGHN